MRVPMRSISTRWSAMAVALGGVLAAACASDPTAPGTGPLAAIAVAPVVTLSVRGTQQFVAVGRDAADRPVAISPTWSLDEGTGSISATGLFTADTLPGTFSVTVRATSGTIWGSASVTVVNGSVTGFSVTPGFAAMAAGGIHATLLSGSSSSIGK